MSRSFFFGKKGNDERDGRVASQRSVLNDVPFKNSVRNGNAATSASVCPRSGRI